MFSSYGSTLNQNLVLGIKIIIVIAFVAILYYYLFPSSNVTYNETLVNTDQTNTSVQSKGEIILYSASWCGNCTNFMPEWNNFSSYAQTNMPFIKVTNMRCEDGNEPVCTQKGVQGYPTVIFYRYDGKEIAYDGNRTSTSLIDFINNNI
jgi:thiol-disulfide isomerase/thioredoxin